MQPPNDVRNFLHRRLGRAARSFVSSGLNPLAAATSFFSQPSPSPSRRRGGSPIPRATSRSLSSPRRQTLTRRLGIRLPSTFGQPGTSTRLAPSAVCLPPFRIDPRTGRCKLFLGTQSGPDPVAVQAGQFGSGMQPMAETRTVRSCLPGMVLGKDGLCYSRRDISNKERAYPKGRRPLGTPAELAALSKAASFGRRMENTVKRMQKIGVLKKPGRRSAPRRQQKLIGPGVVQIQQE